MEVTKCTELPESLAFKVRHPEKLQVFFHIRENITLCLRLMLGAWVHLCNSLDKLLQQTARLDQICRTQPSDVVFLQLHASEVSHNSN